LPHLHQALLDMLDYCIVHSGRFVAESYETNEAREPSDGIRQDPPQIEAREKVAREERLRPPPPRGG